MTLDNIENKSISPFLRWAGGKRWLLRKNVKITPDSYNTYLEPFLGSAAVFLSLPHTPFIISDLNKELINCYKTIRDNLPELSQSLRLHQKNHSPTYYYKIRGYEPSDQIENASRFIYLNQACFNGLYRVNQSGKFNVPIGSKINSIDFDGLSHISHRIKQGLILDQDFDKTLAMAQTGDFVFVDPPYTVNHNSNGFVEYNEKIFSWQDQIRLCESIKSALDRGVMLTVTNADHESIHELYSGIGRLEKLERNSVIAGNPNYRKVTSEVIVRIGW